MLVNYNHREKTLSINQDISFVNNTSKALDTIYLSDWSNSYSSFKTPLAQRFGEEYDRSFYLSKKSKLGYSKINHIGSQEKKLKWNRLENQSDIIRVILEKPLKIDELYKLNLVYLIKIPDSKFNRYGYDQKGNIFLRNWHIILNQNLKGKWLNYSNLDLDDLSPIPAKYDLEITDQNQINIDLNLKLVKKENQKKYFIGNNIKELTLYSSIGKDFNSFNTDNGNIIVTDIFNRINRAESEKTINKIYEFIGEKLIYVKNKKYIIPQIMYERNPFLD